MPTCLDTVLQCKGILCWQHKFVPRITFCAINIPELPPSTTTTSNSSVVKICVSFSSAPVQTEQLSLQQMALTLTKSEMCTESYCDEVLQCSACRCSRSIR